MPFSRTFQGQEFGTIKFQDFRGSVRTLELWWPEVARPGNFVSFLEKRSFSNCRYCTDRAQNLPAPNIWLTLFRISSKSVHFWWSYCRTREDRFCPVEYLEYRLFEPMMIMTSILINKYQNNGYQKKHALLEAFARQLLKTPFSYKFLSREQMHQNHKIIMIKIIPIMIVFIRFCWQRTSFIPMNNRHYNLRH